MLFPTAHRRFWHGTPHRQQTAIEKGHFFSRVFAFGIAAFTSSRNARMSSSVTRYYLRFTGKKAMIVPTSVYPRQGDRNNRRDPFV
jgi:arginase family enzyme